MKRATVWSCAFVFLEVLASTSCSSPAESEWGSFPVSDVFPTYVTPSAPTSLQTLVPPPSLSRVGSLTALPVESSPQASGMSRDLEGVPNSYRYITGVDVAGNLNLLEVAVFFA